MTEKTIDFLKHISTTEGNQILDKKSLMETLESFLQDDEIIWSYVDSLKTMSLEYGLWRDILSCVQNRERCEGLISSLNEEQMKEFSKVVIGMKHFFEIGEFKKLYDATFKLTDPTSESLEKASQLLNIVTESNCVDLEFMAAGLLQLGSHLKTLGGVFYAYRNGITEERSVSRLAQLPEKDFDFLIPLADEIIKTSSVNINNFSALCMEIL